MAVTEAPTMRNSAAVILKGAELPADIVAALGGCDAGAFYAVRIHKLSPDITEEFLQAEANGDAALEAIYRKYFSSNHLKTHANTDEGV